MLKRLFVSFLIVMMTTNQAFAVVIVNNLGDGNDAVDTGGDVCAVTPDGADCTLRAAIEFANAQGETSIEFDDGVFDGTTGTEIYLDLSTYGQFDSLDNASLSLDGSTITEADGIFINGGGGDLSGGVLITLNNTGQTVQGLNLYNYSGGGIQVTTNGDNSNIVDNAIYNINGDGVNLMSNVSGATIKENYIGVDRSLSMSPSAVVNGIVVGIGSSGNTIGGSNAADRNWIGGTDDHGIYLGGASDTLIQNNHIGSLKDTGPGYTNAGLDQNTDNIGSGIYFGGSIGSSTIVEDNVIGYAEEGISFGDSGTYVDGGAHVRGNYIGITPESDDVGNDGAGIHVGSDVGTDLELIIGNDVDNPGTFDANHRMYIGNNGGSGILVESGDRLVANTLNIGVDLDGETPAGNDGAGIEISGNGVGVVDGNVDVLIGTNNDDQNDAGESVVIGANATDGILIDAGSGTTNDISIMGVNIGVTEAGENPAGGQYDLANDGTAGINIVDTTANGIDIGGTSSIDNTLPRNIISNNTGGIVINGTGGTTGSPTGIVVQNNFIGLSTGGITTDPLVNAGNRYDNGPTTFGTGDGIGVDLDNGGHANLQIGTDGDATNDLEERNYIGDNSNGIVLGDGLGEVDIHGNAIGLGLNDLNEVLTHHGNMNNGISVNSSYADFTDMSIGGNGSNESNYIAANGNDGIFISDAGSGTSAASISIESNYLGVGEDGYTAFVNGGNNIRVADGDLVQVIANVIVNATSDGLRAEGGSSWEIKGNQIGLVKDPTGGVDDFIAAGNGTEGIRIDQVDNVNNTTIDSVVIGGTVIDDINVITANGASGIAIANVSSPTSIVEIIGNVVGVAYNPDTGVFLQNTTGGADDGEPNNDFDDFNNLGPGISISDGEVYIGRNQGGTIFGSSIGGSGTGSFLPGNVVSNNVEGGIFIQGTVSSVDIVSTIIGLIKSAPTGTFENEAGNGNKTVSPGQHHPAGIIIDPVDGMVVDVGGTGAANDFDTRNVISGNYGPGINLWDGGAAKTVDLDVVNNHIGTDWLGNSPVGNDEGGIVIGNGSDVVIGSDSDSDAGNVISGNNAQGIIVGRYAQDVDIFGNFIGLNVTGSAGLGNSKHGIGYGDGYVSATLDIGSAADPIGANYISGNEDFGVVIKGDGSGGGNDLLVNMLNNMIGVAFDDVTAIPNGATSLNPIDQRAGVAIDNPTATVNIGDGTGDGANIISENTGFGVILASGELVMNTNEVGLRYDGVTLTSNSQGAVKIISGSGFNGGSVIAPGDEPTFIGNFFDNTIAPGIQTNFELAGESTSVADDNTFAVMSGSFSNAGSPYYFWYRDVSNYEPYACYDGVDNDGDGDIDLADAGCSAAIDDDEYNEPEGGGSGGTGSRASSSNSNSSSESSSSEESSSETTTETTTTETTTEETVEEAVQEDTPQEAPAEVDDIVEALQETASTTSDAVEEAVDTNEIENLEDKIGDFKDDLEDGVDDGDGEETGEEDSEEDDSEEEEEQTEEQKSISEALDVLDDLDLTGSNGGGASSSEERKEKLDAAEKAIEKLLSASEQEDGEEGEEVDFEWGIEEGEEVDPKKVYPFSPVKFKDPETGEEIKDPVSPLLVLKDGKSPKVKPKVPFARQFFVDGDLKGDYEDDEDLLPDTCKITNIDNYDTIAGTGMITFAGEDCGEVKVSIVEEKEKEATAFDYLGSMMASVVSSDENLLVRNDDYSYKDHHVGDAKVTANGFGVGIIDTSEVGLDFKKTESFYIVAETSTGHTMTKKVDIDPNAALKEIDPTGVKLEQDGKKIGTGDGQRSLSAALFNSVLSSAGEEEGEAEPIKVKGYVKPGTVVFITWESLVYNSVVVADASQGYFETDAPDELAYGDHEMTLFAYHDSGSVLSNISQLLFSK